MRVIESPSRTIVLLALMTVCGCLSQNNPQPTPAAMEVERSVAANEVSRQPEDVDLPGAAAPVLAVDSALPLAGWDETSSATDQVPVTAETPQGVPASIKPSATIPGGAVSQMMSVSPNPKDNVSATPSPVSTVTSQPVVSHAPVQASPSPQAASEDPASGLAPVQVVPPPVGTVSGQIWMNGKPPQRKFSLTLVRVEDGKWSQGATIQSADDGGFVISGLRAGDYLVYFYNDSQRDVIGYWKSRVQHLTEKVGVSFPPIDFYQKGMNNIPPMDAHITLPFEFQWIPPAQPVSFYRWRLHSTAGRAFELLYQSEKLDAGTMSFQWAVDDLSLDPNHRYFWGLFWDAGAAGEGGNLYQSVYF